MLFNSLDFAIFLPLAFVIYWFALNRSLKLQNAFLLLASYIFYAWWDYRFLSLIIISTLVDYFVGKALKSTHAHNKRKLLLLLSLGCNLGMLMFFKYYNFFLESWLTAWNGIGVEMHASTLSIILPVGISFYTFQTLSYTIDVYRQKIKPTDNLIQFSAYVAFFPQLVAGPIERAARLLPQFKVQRIFDYQFAMSGFYLIIWGMFKKVVVADNCAFFVNQIFENPTAFSSMELGMGAILFGFQIYGDFSGYSDIAIGIARLFGFSLMTNFKFPYFSRDIAEFWRRWHISLSTWFRDYLYIPLGGSRGGKFQIIRNVLIIFLVSGFWHGANSTFIIWGLIHALLFIPLILLGKNRNHLDTTRMQWSQIHKITITFILVSLAWIYFRADSLSIANDYVWQLISMQGFSLDIFIASSKNTLFAAIVGLSILIMLIREFFTVQYNKKEVQLRPFLAVCIVILIAFMGVFKEPADFIYFQF